MTDEEEIREVFRKWFDASERKDLDGSMEPIADDVVSYEHDVPLEYVGADAVREVCKRGFDASLEHIRWDIPELEIIIRGDIAVTWGLNRMANEQAGKQSYELWSRGTRIFQKRDGRWQMIHQHVSFPYDSETGKAVMDLKPEAG